CALQRVAHSLSPNGRRQLTIRSSRPRGVAAACYPAFAAARPLSSSVMLLREAMTKSEFLKLMQFPAAWLELDMYPESLFAGQLNSYTLGAETASEHFRNGAFHWWLKQQPTEQQLLRLALLCRLDPDQLMAQDAQRYIRRAASFSPQV